MPSILSLYSVISSEFDRNHTVKLFGSGTSNKGNAHSSETNVNFR